MKTGVSFTIERCLTGYIVHDYGRIIHDVSLPSACSSHINAFSHKEHVLDFLRKNLTFDVECGNAKEIKK